MRTHLCSVCATAQANYKCPSCATTRYCSVACYSQHKESCQPAEKPVSTFEDRFVPSGPLTERKWSIKVSAEQKMKLWCSEEMKLALANPELQKIIKEIDSSKHSRALLQKHMEENPKFSEFIESLLDVIDYDPFL